MPFQRRCAPQRLSNAVSPKIYRGNPHSFSSATVCAWTQATRRFNDLESCSSNRIKCPFTVGLEISIIVLDSYSRPLSSK